MLVALLYASVLGTMFTEWWHTPTLRSGFVVLAFVAFLVARKRTEFATSPARPAWSGMLLIAGSVMLLVAGILASEFFLTRFSLLFLLAGLIVYFWGWKHFRLMLVPWLFLLLMIPVPTIVFNQIGIPLKFLAAKMAGSFLALWGVPVLTSESSLQLPWISMEIIDAEGGMEWLMALITLIAIYGYLFESRVSVRLVLATLAVPALLLASVARVAGAGLLGMRWGAGAAEDFYQGYAGFEVFACAMLIILAAHLSLRFALLWGRKP